MAVELDPAMVTRIAELLDLFAELPSTPPVLTGEARQHAETLMELVEGGNPRRGPEQGRRTWPPEEQH